jgi:glycosyltransferase involved in cell wall biosynthesis
VAVAALSKEWDLEVCSWLPDVGTRGLKRWKTGPLFLFKVLALAAVRPVGAAYVQAVLPRQMRLQMRSAEYDQVLFVTDRAVPCFQPPGFVLDFVDDFGGAALRRSGAAKGPVSVFWRVEGRRIRRLDNKLASRARVAIACNPVDAQAISPALQVVPLAVAAGPMPEKGDTIAFLGNLFYPPNHEAAMWICEHLAPELTAGGFDPSRIVVAGRRPRRELVDAAGVAGVKIRADLADLSQVLREAAVVLAPMVLGSGTQNKVLDAVGAGRPCVISPLANASLNLVDGRSALICEREPKPFADAVLKLLEDDGLSRSIVTQARVDLNANMAEQVHATWCAALR